MGYNGNKLKNNTRERSVQKELMQDGWKVLYKGWPDFLFYKEFNDKIEAFFLEVKRKPYGRPYPTKGNFLQTKTSDVKLSREQEKMHYILKKLGLEVKVIYKD